ncbi:hypothetical protein E0Z10_g9440 [Xylaria hypoxylon]|uniref:Helicase C-terminal domain-containing protein n=1 Tax=Xylaria hypoxylon TaxID=37992 RepID=A0A4Z0YKE9_9PEZI|nr:hypothetical protein E0Z10_g9440 [Xylaria hypoxylon]
MDPPSSSGGEAESTPRANVTNIRDLDEMTIIIRRGKGQSDFYLLTDFLTQEGLTSVIRVASDFDYDNFRTVILDQMSIPKDAILYTMYRKSNRESLESSLIVPGNAASSPQYSTVIPITSRSTFIIALTQIQAVDLLDTGAFLRYHWYLTTDPQDTPAPPRRPKPDPVTPERPNPNQGQNPPPRPPSSEDSNSDESSHGGRDRDLEGDRGKGGNNNPVIQHLNLDFAAVDEESWRQVCRLFSCDLNATRIRVAGISADIEPYQAFAIWRALVQVVRGNASFIIGDDVGFGKTGMALCVATIFHMMQDMDAEVSKDRSLNPLTPGVRKHLPRVQAPGATCPTQSGRIQCPCVNDSLSIQVVHAVGDLPTVIISPAGLIPNWVGESTKWIDSSPGSPSERMRIFVAHEAWRSSPQYFGKQHEKLISSEPVNSGGRLFKDYKDDGSKYIILISPLGVNQFLDRFGRPNPLSLRRPIVYGFAAGFFFFDEFHDYSGHRNSQSQTIPFRALETIGFDDLDDEHQVVAIGLSGSARSDIKHWRPFLRHAIQMNQTMNRGRIEIAGVSSMTEFALYESSWNYLVENLNVTTLPANILRERDERRDKLFDFLRIFFPQMMVARRRGDTFRGQNIDLVAGRPIDIRCDMEMGATRDAFRSFVARVKSWVRQEYQIALNAWNEGGQEGERPTRRSAAQRSLENVVENRSLNSSGSAEFQILSRSSAFPAVARVIRENRLGNESTLARNILPIAKKLSSLLSANRINRESRAKVLEELMSSPWWEHRDLLLQESPKHKIVEQEIDRLLDIATKVTDDPSLGDAGPPPEDGTNIRHALIFADCPLSAFLTVMLLFPKYQDKNLVLMYAHGGTEVQKRAQYCEYIQQDCHADYPVKILVSTMDIMGQGYNLFRVNTVILTEVPRTSARQNQAFGRVNRRGQVMVPRLIQLHDTINLAEEVRRIRNANRSQLADTGREQFPLADLILDGNEQDDDNDDSDEGGPQPDDDDVFG